MGQDFLYWQIILRDRLADKKDLAPSGILTFAPTFRHENMPDEISLLLPTNDGPRALIDAVMTEDTRNPNAALGLFLADPFLNFTREAARLKSADVQWIANLPSIEQQDRDFSQQLDDVELDFARECRMLAAFRREDFRIAVVVADAESAEQAVRLSPDLLIILPRIADFAAGFPSRHQRGTIAQMIRSRVSKLGWHGPLLGLGEAAEAAHESQWPDALDGLLLRPVPLASLSA